MYFLKKPEQNKAKVLVAKQLLIILKQTLDAKRERTQGYLGCCYYLG